MDLKFELIDDIAFAYVNGVKGTLSKGDVGVLLHHYNQLPMNSKYADVMSSADVIEKLIRLECAP